MKGIKTIVLVLMILLSSSVSVAFSKNDTFSVNYTFEPAIVEGGEFLVKDTQIREIPGEPLIPYRAARILLPQGVAVKNVNVRTGTAIVQTGFDIPWGQPPCTFSDEPVIVGRNEKIYSSDKLYPSEVFDFVSVEYFRGFAILNVRLFPVQYKPKSGTVYFYETMTVEVQSGKSVKHKLYRGLPEDKAAVADMVDNPEMAETYSDGTIPLATEEYIIITNDTMQSVFQQLADWKAHYVIGTGVYTVSWIYSNYSGVDDPEKIRNFIIDKYTNNGTKYVLLGGDVAAVPYRGFYVSTGGYTDSDMLADMYFGHLDGNHNADGDSRWGETNDNVDFTAEVAVGRASCQSTAEAQAFVDKVIAYEQMDKPKRVCFHQSRVQPGNSPDSRCLAYNCDDYIPGDYYIDYLFEEDGTVTKTKWRNAWAADPIVVVHIGHGNTDIYHINYEVGGTVSWYNSDVPSLTNTFFPWTTSVACITGEIEADDCLAEAYVKDDCGAIGALYNDNYGWFSTLNACQYSGEFCEMEVRACWSDGYEKLGDMLNLARSYLVSSAQSNSVYRWCFYERNLVGDPESPCLSTRGCIRITNPQEDETVSCTVTITAETSWTEGVEVVKFYIDDVYEGWICTVHREPSKPFECVWDTCPYLDGYHTIIAEAYGEAILEDSGEILDVLLCSDEIGVYVENDRTNCIEITNPQDGAEVYGIVHITTDYTCCVDEVEFYIDGNYKSTEFPPGLVDYYWNTFVETEDEEHTILVEAYYENKLMCTHEVTVIVNNYYVEITSPQNGAEVSGTIIITVDARGIDELQFYIREYYMGSYSIGEDDQPPFEYSWDTTQYPNGTHSITVKGYVSIFKKDEHTISCTISNQSMFIFIGLFFGVAGIVIRRC